MLNQLRVANGSSTSADSDECKDSLRLINKQMRDHNKFVMKVNDHAMEMDILRAEGKRQYAEVHRLCRRRAHTGIGVKKRDHRSALAGRPTKAEWTEYLAQPGEHGGCSAETAYPKAWFTAGIHTEPLHPEHASDNLPGDPEDLAQGRGEGDELHHAPPGPPRRRIWRNVGIRVAQRTARRDPTCKTGFRRRVAPRTA